jgi:hypothetical protein
VAIFGCRVGLFVGVLCFVVAIKSGKYAAVGSTPEMWLNQGTINGGDNAVAAMLAYITFHHSKRIEICDNGNKRKAGWIDAGIYLGPAAPVAFLILFLSL